MAFFIHSCRTCIICSNSMPGMLVNERWLKPYTLAFTGLLLGLLVGEGTSGRVLLLMRNSCLPAQQRNIHMDTTCQHKAKYC